MAGDAAPALRNLFDLGEKPAAPRRPQTWAHDIYVATDGAYLGTNGPAPSTEGSAGLGIVIETAEGNRIESGGSPIAVPDNVTAEYAAVVAGMKRAADHGAGRRVGILVDMEPIARYLNRTARFVFDASCHDPVDHLVPNSLRAEWRALEQTMASCSTVTAARIPGNRNPAHSAARASVRRALGCTGSDRPQPGEPVPADD